LTKLDKTFYEEILAKDFYNMILFVRLIIDLLQATLFFAVSSSLYSTEYKKTPGFQLYVGPEIYHVHRKKESGSKQDGMVYAVHAGYDRIERYKFYFGFDALYGEGVLSGKNRANDCLRSNFSDTYAEGRLGYTLQSKCRWRPQLTPYFGLGYFIEKNDFTHPKEMPFHFKTTYLYAVAGFLSQLKLTDRLDVGFNFKFKYPYNVNCRASHDPLQNDFTQGVKEKPHYRVELPLTYRCFENSDHLRVSLIPFYELRRYGYHPNFPCDFLETRLDIYGIQIKLMYYL